MQKKAESNREPRVIYKDKKLMTTERSPGFFEYILILGSFASFASFAVQD